MPVANRQRELVWVDPGLPRVNLEHTCTGTPVLVVDDGACCEGGSKVRGIGPMYAQIPELVYATMATSWTPVAMGIVARQLDRIATWFVPWRKEKTGQVLIAQTLGVNVIEVGDPSYKREGWGRGSIDALKARAREYTASRGASCRFLSTGFASEEIFNNIAATAAQLGMTLDQRHEVWCAGGSGVLTGSLQRSWPIPRHCVARIEMQGDYGKAHEFPCPKPYDKLEKEYKGPTPFSMERHFEAKAWRVMELNHTPGKILVFWSSMKDLYKEYALELAEWKESLR